MNEYAVLHIPESKYCFPVSKNEVVLRLRTARGETLKHVTVFYGNKYEFLTKRDKAEMKKEYSDRLYDYYIARLKLADVRLAYIFYLDDGIEPMYYSEDGLTKTYNFSLAYYNFFQLSYINPADIHEVVPWMKETVFYQIFVERFRIGSEGKKKEYINLNWGEIPDPKSFAGGDLNGIREKLDYIKNLGCNALYLTPVFESISNHKYDISDYKKIDEQFGGDKALKQLIEEAHAMGIRIVLDAVFNHCSDRLEQFQDVLKKGRDSQYFDWFFIDGDTADQETVNYECFAACAYMPKLNTSNPEVQNFLLDIAVYYIREYDIDGWRLDVSDEVSHAFWREFRKAVKAAKKDIVIIGENWHDANAYLRGDQYDSIMNYAFTKACLDYFINQSLDAQGYIDKLSEILMRNTDMANDMMLNLLDCHDTHRFLTQAEGKKEKLLAALAVLMFYPGTPCIYYGTEIAMEGGYDPDCRRTFDWEEEHWDKEFHQIVKQLISLRRKQVLSYGNIEFSVKDGMCVIKRKYQKETLSLLINRTGQEQKLPKGELLLTYKENAGKLAQEGFAIQKCIES